MLVGMIKNEISQKEGKTWHNVQCHQQPGQAFMATGTRLFCGFNR
jgi:hypothetical protein